MASSLDKVEVKNGQGTSFWHDQWSDLGRVADLVGERGVVDMGIGWQISVAEAWTIRRRRRHRDELLMQIENTLQLQREKCKEENDKHIWKGAKAVYKSKFSTKDTWNHLRATSTPVDWHNGVWFSHGTPKYSFCVWLAVHNRLSTGDRMLKCNVGASGQCVLCNNTIETREHLFFECGYSAAVWTGLAKNIFGPRFSSNWQANLDFISENHQRVKGFLIRYVFQAVVHAIWRERNGRVHGEDPNSPSRHIHWIDKHIRNQLSMIRLSGDKRYESGLQMWFASRF